MYKSLKEFIATLERHGELVRIQTSVNPELEITEIVDRESKRPGGGRALLFENTGTAFPVLINMMGSDRRIALALGVDRVEELTQRLETLFTEWSTPKFSLVDKLRMLPLLERMSRWLPRHRSGRGSSQQVVLTGEKARLSLLPILKCWPHDGGRFITLPLVHTLDPDTGIRNVGMYRMQVLGPHHTAMHWHMHKTGERHYRRYQALGRRMPVAVCLGGDPAYTYAATAPMPDHVDEYLLAGFLRGAPVDLVQCLTSDIRVPNDCDFVIEGYVDPSEPKTTEGPFGDHTGFYSLEDEYPVFHVTAITHCRDAVYPATIVGVPPQEDFYMAKASEKIFLVPMRRVLLPEVEDFYMPPEGVIHNLILVSIRNYFVAHGLKVAASLWGTGQMMFNKFMVVLPEGVDLRDNEAVRRYLRRVSIPQQVLLMRGPLDVLDHTAPQKGVGGKMALDLTELSRQEPLPIHLPELWRFTHGIVGVNVSLAESWGVLWLYAEREVQLSEVEHFMISNDVSGISFVVMVDPAAEPLNDREKLWMSCSNCDPSRDVHLYGGWILFDARIKAEGINGFDRPWPNVVASSPETIQQVDRRWNEYGLGDFIPSPSLRYLPLQSHPSATYDAKKAGQTKK